jgi:hypothetical protein
MYFLGDKLLVLNTYPVDTDSLKGMSPLGTKINGLREA